MGNSPSIPGLNGGRTHVRDDSRGGSQMGRTPGQSRILDESESEEVEIGEAILAVPEPPISYIIAVRSCHRPQCKFSNFGGKGG